MCNFTCRLKKRVGNDHGCSILVSKKHFFETLQSLTLIESGPAVQISIPKLQIFGILNCWWISDKNGIPLSGNLRSVPGNILGVWECQVLSGEKTKIRFRHSKIARETQSNFVGSEAHPFLQNMHHATCKRGFRAVERSPQGKGCKHWTAFDLRDMACSCFSVA